MPAIAAMMVPEELVFSIDDGTWKRVVEPVEFTEKSVDVALPAVEEPMAKSTDAACAEKSPPAKTESLAKGEVEPMPTEPFKSAVPPTLSPAEMVVEPVTASAEVVAAVAESLIRVVWPVLSIVNSVVVAKAEVEDAMAKSVRGEVPTLVDAANMERVA